jgi:L-amino acid N-acyltransferase YncA
MNGHLMIRPTCEKDAAALARIYAYYVEKTAITFEYTAPDTTEMERRRQEISQRYPYLVAESDGKVVGYAYAHAFYGREAYAWSVESSIYVDVNIRKHGIGRKLYEALEKALKSMGILNINACIAVPRDNQDPYVTNGSMNFHQRLGYTLVGRFHNSGYKFDRWYDVVWMEKMIGPHTVHPRFPAKNETLFAL